MLSSVLTIRVVLEQQQHEKEIPKIFLTCLVGVISPNLRQSGVKHLVCARASAPPDTGC